MSNRSLLSIALPLALLLAGCGDPPPPPDGDPPAGLEETTPTPEEAPVQDPMEEMAHVTIPLDEANGTGVSGEAMLMYDDDTIIVVVDVEGFPTEGEYAAHIHSGSCAEGGPVAAPLNPILGLADGTGTSTTTLEGHEVELTAPHFIQIHGEGGSPITCGDLVH